MNVEKLTAAQVQAMLARELTRGMSSQTVVHLRAILRRAMNRALRFGMVSRNVVALTDPPKVEEDDPRVLDVVQAQAFLEAARNDRLRGLTLALLTGLRQGELLGLRWQDVDLDGAQLHVSHSLQRHGGRRQLVPPKTGGSMRTVVIPALAVEALREHRACQVEERLFAGPQWEERGVVFATRRGTPLEPGNVVRSFKRVLRAADLPT